MDFKQNKHEKSGSPFLRRWTMRGAAAVALMTTLLAGCQNPGQQASTPDQQNVSTEEVANNTKRYIGQTVTVRSEPIQKISPSTFTIEDDQFFGSQPILVVNASGQPFTFPAEAGTDIQVTGQVRNFVFADVEREYNLGLEANAYREYENQPAVIAQSIALAPEPGTLTREPQQYYGKPLAVTGEVEAIQGTNAFTLDEDQLFGAQDLLVLRVPKSANQVAVQNGEKVAVTGVLRPFVVAELERYYGFNWDTGIQQKLEAEYENKPVLVAENVYPSAIPDSAQ